MARSSVERIISVGLLVSRDVPDPRHDLFETDPGMT